MLFTRVFPTIITNLQCTRLFSTINSILQPAFSPQIKPGGLFELAVRTNIRVHFPRPNERKRIKRHGWKKRLSTEAGRRILMNKILKGKHVYSH